MIRRVRDFPTSVTSAEMERYLGEGCTGVHESTLRAYHILTEVKRYLELGTPASVVLEIIEEMERHD